MADPLVLKPKVYSPEDFTGLIKTARENTDPDTADKFDPMKFVAMNVAAAQDPNVATYRGLRDGSAPWLKQEGFNKKLTDQDIVQLLVRDQAGRAPIAGASPDSKTFLGLNLSGFMRGFKEEAPVEAAVLAGGFGGYKAAQKAVALTPVIPSPPPLMAFQAAARFLTPIGAGIYTAVEASDAAQDIQAKIAPRNLYLPGTTTDVEMGRTAAGVLTGIALPFLAARSGIQNVIDFFDTRELMTKNAQRIRQAVIDSELAVPTTAVASDKLRKYYKKSQKLLDEEGTPTKASLPMRGLQQTEKFIKRMGTEARAEPVKTVAKELVAGAGIVGGAGYAESISPDDPLLRLGLETVGGIATSPVQTGVGIADQIPQKLGQAKRAITDKGIIGATKEGYKAALRPLKERSASGTINELIDAINRMAKQGVGEDELEEIIAKLEVDDPLDPETGERVAHTAGTKTGSMVLMAYENAIRDLAPQKMKAAKKAIQLMAQNVKARLDAGEKAQPAYMQAVDDLIKITANGLNAEIDRATNKVTDAFFNLKNRPSQTGETGRVPVGTFGELGENIRQIVDQQYKLARRQESSLWNEVGDIPITTFRNAEGEEIAQPNFIQTFDNLVAENVTEGGTFITKDFLMKYGEPIKYILGKKAALGLGTTPADRILIKKLGLERDFETARGILNKAEEEARALTPDDIATLDALGIGYNRVISTKLLDNFKKMFRNKAVELNAKQDNDSRFGFALSDALRLDLESVNAEDASEAYTVARAFTRALHDVFTRSIVGNVLKRQKNEALGLQPEEVIQTLFRRRNDVTYNRITDVLNLGDFARRQEFPGAEDTYTSLQEVTEDIIRSIVADGKLVDPTTNKVRGINALQTWRQQNQQLLALFPNLNKDLIDLENANALLATQPTRKIDPETGLLTEEFVESVELRKKNLAKKAQEKGSAAKVFGTAAPVHEISKVMSSSNAPQGLRNLLKNLDSAKENRKKFLMEDEEDPLTEAAAEKEAAIFEKQAQAGITEAFYEWAMTKATDGQGNFRPSIMLTALFDPITKAKGDIEFGGASLIEFLGKNKLITENDANVLQNSLTEMLRYEMAAQTGRLEDVAKKAGPLLDLYLRLSGAAIGTRLGAALGGSELIAGGAGSRFMREVVNGVPNILTQEVMLELFTDPKRLATLLKQGKTEKEAYGAVESFFGWLRQKGLTPLRREVPSIRREAEEEAEAEEFREDLPSFMQELREQPTAMTAPPQQPAAQVAMNMDTQPTVPVSRPTAPPASPQQRQQYAAMYPFDPVSELIRTGRA